jgi:transcriptional regulator with XRE-family HTH domain
VPPPTLQGRINRLFEVCRPPGEPEREYHNKEVVAAVKATGRELSESHLSELRRGVKDNPTVRVLDTLAWFFQVRPGYFIDPQAAIEVEAELAGKEEQLRTELQARAEVADLERELREAMAHSGVTGMAHRAAGGMSSRDRAKMMRLLIDVLREDADHRTQE